MSIKFDISIPAITVNVHVDSGEICQRDLDVLNRLLKQSERLVRRLEKLDAQTPDQAT